MRGKGAQEASGDNTLVKKCVTLRLAARKSLQFVLGPRGSTVFPETLPLQPLSTGAHERMGQSRIVQQSSIDVYLFFGPAEVSHM